MLTNWLLVLPPSLALILVEAPRNPVEAALASR